MHSPACDRSDANQRRRGVLPGCYRAASSLRSLGLRYVTLARQHFRRTPADAEALRAQRTRDPGVGYGARKRITNC
jgi:hypothetical protein